MGDRDCALKALSRAYEKCKRGNYETLETTKHTLKNALLIFCRTAKAVSLSLSCRPILPYRPYTFNFCRRLKANVGMLIEYWAGD